MAGLTIPIAPPQRPSVTKRTPSRNEDFFHETELRELHDYIRPLRRAKRLRFASVNAVLLVLVFGADLGPTLAGWVDGQGWFVRLLVVGAAFTSVETLVEAPFGYWVNLVYEKRSGLSTMTLPVWLKDQAIGLLLGSVFVGAVFGPVYAAIHAFESWWLVAGLAVLAVIAVISFVYPVLIMPRFNKFTPLEDGPIRRRIEEIAAMSGVAVEGVYLMDASKRTTRPNAGVVGFGKTKRVIINDTISEFPIDELSQVIAHELGHDRLRHTIKDFPLTALQLPLALLFVQLVCGHETVLGWAGVEDLGDPASFGLVALGFGVATAAARVPATWLQRKHEREADLEALELLRDPTTFIAVWPRMVLDHKANLEPTPWEHLTATHPGVAERMQFGLDWAEMNGITAVPPAPRSLPEPVG